MNGLVDLNICYLHCMVFHGTCFTWYHGNPNSHFQILLLRFEIWLKCVWPTQLYGRREDFPSLMHILCHSAFISRRVNLDTIRTVTCRKNLTVWTHFEPCSLGMAPNLRSFSSTSNPNQVYNLSPETTDHYHQWPKAHSPSTFLHMTRREASQRILTFKRLSTTHTDPLPDLESSLYLSSYVKAGDVKPAATSKSR